MRPRSMPLARLLLLALAALALSQGQEDAANGQPRNRLYLPQVHHTGVASLLLTLDEDVYQRGAVGPTVLGDRLFYQRACGQLLVAGPAPGMAERLAVLGGPENCPGVDATPLGGQVLYGVNYNDRMELWRSDGTAAGTTRVRTFTPAGSDLRIQHEGFTALGASALFFVTAWSDLEQISAELWRTDGTQGGTVLLKTLTPSFWRPTTLGALSGTFYFTASVGGDQARLWASDGTAEGTRVVAAVPSTAYVAGVAGDKLWFTVDDLPRTYALWASDGTAEGTRKVRAFGGSAPVSFTALGERVFFGLIVPPYGGAFDLWTSDGTEEGTRRVAPVAMYGSPTALGGHIYFNNNGSLYRSDGTTAGTQDMGVSLGGEIMAAGGRLFIPSLESGLTELWVYGGATAALRPVQNFGKGLALDYLTPLAASPTTLYIVAREQGGPSRLWAVQMARVP